MEPVPYLADVFPDAVFYLAPIDGPRPGQGRDGYGRKIATDYAARFAGRTHRVYCVCYSNAGSLYVKHRGRDLYIGGMDMRATAPLPPELRGGLARRSH